MRWRAVTVTCLLLVSVGIAVTTYVLTYRAERVRTDAIAAVVDAASRGSIALLSYAPESVDRDLATARSQLTGEFLTYYSQFADEFVAPAARDKGIRATASVVRASVIEVSPENAQVLLFLDQATTSRDQPEAVQAASSVKVGLSKVEDDWKISSFDPL